MFWGIFFINRDYIYPQVIEEVIPNWQNHINHTLPIFGVIIESFMAEHHYEKSFIKKNIPIVLFGFSYLIL